MIIVRLAMVGLICAAIATGANECSLKVVVSSSNGTELDVPVVVKMSNGRIFKKRHQAGGVTFCDLGIKPVKIIIGDECNQVILSNVELEWGAMRTVRAIHDRCRGLDGPASSACQVLIMVRDETGAALSKATVKFTQPVAVTYSTDTYGRVRTGFGFGKSVAAVIEMTGFLSGEVQFECTADKPTIETDVVLKRLP